MGTSSPQTRGIHTFQFFLELSTKVTHYFMGEYEACHVCGSTQTPNTTFFANMNSIDTMKLLTKLSDAEAESLSNHQGELVLSGLMELSDAAAESLSKHEDLDLGGLPELSDAAAESLSKQQGNLYLYGLTELSDAAADSLSKHRGELDLTGLSTASKNAWEALRGNPEISIEEPEDESEDWD
jgi:hypothetical protein